ncbi:MAG: ATP-binding protein [Phycisphaerales bacterium]|jgi:serine/threonine-protein kinase RsbW
MAASHGQHDRALITVVNDPAAIERAEDRVVEALTRFNYPRASVFAVRLSLHEAMSNGFRHGHRSLPEGTPISVQFDATDDTVEIIVEDQGPGFDPNAIPDPTLEENLERGSGRGLLLIRAYMTSAEYNSKGNRLQMTYRRPPGA